MNKTILLIGVFSVFVWTSVLVLLNQKLSFIIWGDFLILINLYLSSPLLSSFQEKNSSKLIGSLPSINIAVFFGSIISLSLMFLFSNGIFISNARTHLILQIIIFGLTLIPSLFLLLAGQLASNRAEGLLTREDLLKFIDKFNILHKDKFNDPDIESHIAELTEYIRYKLPHPSAINLSEYKNFSENLKKFSEITNEDSQILLSNNLKELIKQVKVL